MVGRGIALLILVLMLMSGAALPAAAAANARSSCIATIVSNTAPPDVKGFKALAAQAGAPNFGALVSGGAKAHFGDLAACLPE